MDVDASATAAAGLAARLAALRARQQLTAHATRQTQHHEGPAADMAEAQQQQQQQQDEEDDQHVPLLDRLRVLQQRQVSQQQQDLHHLHHQQQQQWQEGDVLQRIKVLQQRQSDQQQQEEVLEEEYQQEERVSSGPLDTLQQLQPLFPDQQQQDSSQVEQQHQQQQQQRDDSGQAKQQQQQLDQVAAELLQKMLLLHQRQAQAQQQQQQQPPAVVLQGDQLQYPEDFIHCLRDMLATEKFPVSLNHGDYEDLDELECEVSGAAAAAAASGAEPAPGWHAAEGIASQQAGPHVNGSSQECDQDRPEVAVQQQQQCDHQQQVAPDHMVPGHARNLLVLAAQSITAGQYKEARVRAAAAAAAATASTNSSSAVASFCREAQKLSAIALLLDSVPQKQWFAALQLVSPEPADTNPAAAAENAPGSSSVTVQDVQRSYRRLAALVHPDKCRHPCAEAAFKALSTAYDQALRVLGSQGMLNPIFGDMEGSAGFSNGFSDGFGSNNPPMEDPAGFYNPSDDVSSDYAWWSEWERDVSAGFVDGAAAAGGGGSSTVPTAADEEDELWRISMQDLAAEVERRQAGALRPQCEADAARPALERQKRLRVARTVLSARMQQHRQASAAAVVDDSDGVGLAGGGFMCDDDVGGQQTTGWRPVIYSTGTPV